MTDDNTITLLLDKQEAELTKLHSALSKELDILQSRELSTLEKVSTEKESILNNINHIDQEIGHHTSLDTLQQDEDHKEQVARIINLLHDCKKKKNENQWANN